MNRNTRSKEKEEYECFKRKMEDLGLYEKNMSIEQMKKLSAFINNTEINLSPESESEPDNESNKLVPEATIHRIGKPVNTSKISQNKFKANEVESKDDDSKAVKSVVKTNPASKYSSLTVTKTEKLDPDNNKKNRLASPDSYTNVGNLLLSSTSYGQKQFKYSWKTNTDIWNINILTPKVLENDVPLKARKFKPPKKPIYSVVDDNIMIPEDVLRKEMEYLSKMSEYHHNLLMESRLDRDEFKWEAPIKAKQEETRASSSMIEVVQPDENEFPELPKSKDRQDLRYNLRKTKASDYNEIDDSPKSSKSTSYGYNSSPEDGFDDFVKKTSKKENKESKTTKKSSFVLKQPLKRSIAKKKINTDEKAEIDITGNISPVYEPEEDFSIYDVIKPSPANKSGKSKPKAQVKGKKKEGLNDEEIEAMITDDEDEKKIDNMDVAMNNDDGGPTRFPASERIVKGIWYSTNSNQTRENRKRKQEEIADAQMESSKRDRQEKVEKARKAEADKEMMLKEEEKAEKEKAEKYNITYRRSQKRVELDGGSSRKSEVFVGNSSLNKSLQEGSNIDDDEMRKCPICNKLFKPSLIEKHAGICEEFTQPENENNDIDKDLKCKVCSLQFTNEELLNNHVDNCIESLISDDNSDPKSEDNDVICCTPESKKRTRQRKSKN